MNNYQIFFHAILVTILLSLQTAFAAEVKPKITEEDLKIIEQFVILPAKLKSVVTQHIMRLTDENVERIKKGLSPIIIFHDLFLLLAQLYKNEIDVLCDSEVLKIEQYKSGAIINIYDQLAFVLNTMSGDSNTRASRIFKLDENFTQEQYCQVVCFAVRSALPISFDIKNTNIVFQLGENWIVKFGECLRKYMIIHFPNNICNFSLISFILSEHTQYPKSILMAAVMEIQNELLTLSGDVSSFELEILAIRNRIHNKIQEIVNRKITFNKSIPTCNFEVLKHTCLAHHGGVNICYVNSFGHTIRCHSLELIILINYLRKNLKILIDNKYKQYSDQDLTKCAVIGDNALKFFDAMFKNFFDNIVEDPAMTESELEIERKTLWQIFFAMIKNAIDKLVFREIDFERFDYHAPGVQIIVSNLKEQFNQFRFGLLINTFEAMHNEIIKNEFAVHKTMYADFCRDKNLIIKINSKFQQLTNDLIEEERLGRIATDRCEEIEYRNQMLLGHTIQECLIRTEEENQRAEILQNYIKMSDDLSCVSDGLMMLRAKHAKEKEVLIQEDVEKRSIIKAEEDEASPVFIEYNQVLIDLRKQAIEFANESYLDYKKRQHQEMVNNWALYGQMVQQRLNMQAQQQTHKEYLNCMKQEFIKLMIHSWAALGTIINDFKKENEVLKHRADELYLEYKKRQHKEMVNSWALYGQMVQQRLKMQARQQTHKEYLNDFEKENEVLPHMAEMRANGDRAQPAQPTVSQTYTHNPYAVSDTVAPVEHPDAASNLELTQRPVCYRHDPYGFNGCWRKDL